MAATKRNFILPSGIGISADNIYASNTTNSTTIGTGSFISLGGAGIAKSISIGGYLQLFNGSNYTAFVSSASGNTIYTLPATTPATGSSVLQSTSAGVMSWVAMTATGAASGFTTLNGLTAGIQYFATGTSGSGFNISSSGSTHTFNIPIAGSGSTGLISTGTQTIAGAKTFSSDLSVTSSTASTNSTTGALVITGGVGIGDSLFVAGNISFNTGTNGLLFRKLVAGNYGAIYSTNVTPSATNYTMITDGASVNFNGTNGVYFNVNNSNKIQVTTNNINIVPTADSTSTSTGALTVAGGVGIGGSLYVASATAISGVSINAGIITGNLTGTATTATNINIVNASTNSAHPIHFSPNATGSGLATSSNTTLSYNPSTLVLSTSGLAITAGTASTNSSTGALVVTGGVGIGGSLFVGGDLTINGTTTTINSVTLTVDDKNIEIGSVTSPSDVTAEGGGITLKGATDKFLNWYTGTGWSSSESFNLINGNTYRIANTSVLSATSLGTGVTNSSLTATGIISSGTWSASGITAKYGGTGYSTYTKGDLLVGLGDTFFKLPVGTQGQLLQAFPSATSGIAWTSIMAPTYGAFYSMTTQKVTGAGISTPITLSSTYEAYNVQILGGSGTSSRIQVQTAGTYNIQFSAQISQAQGASSIQGDIWLRINGIDSPRSNGESTVTGSGNVFVVSWNYVLSLAANDYFELMMSSSDQHFQVEARTGLTSPPRPDIPSMILTVVPVTQVVGSSAGLGVSGIVSLNGLNNYIQYFATGNNGTDFNISSSSQTHTINIPIAGTGATGLLTSQAQTIGGSKTFASPIIGSLTGTATTATNVNVVFANSNGSHPVLFTPTSGSASGVAISSNATLVYSPSTDTLSVSGLAVTSGTASTNSSTGALTVSGGVGIGGSLFAGTSIAVDTGVFGLSLQRASGGSLGAIYSTGVTPSISNYSFATDGTNLNLNSTSNVYLNISNTVKATISTNNINIGINVASTSTTTGAFTVTGGVGIGGSLYVGGASSLSGVSFNVGSIGATSSTASTSSSTGALIVTGGVGIGQSASIGGRLQLFNSSNYTAFVSSASGNTVYTLPATSPATGSSVLQSTSAGVMSWVPMTVSGGLAVSGTTDGVVQFKVGSSLGATASLFFDTNLLGLRISGFPGGNTPSGTDAVLKLEGVANSFNGSTNGTYYAANAPSGFAGDLMNLQVNAVSKFRIDNTGAIIQNIGTNSTSTTSGAVQIKGGVGITGAVFVGESINATSTTNSTNTSTGSLIVSGGAGFAGTINVGGTQKIFSSTASTNTWTGALTVGGGVGISGQLTFAQASFGYTGINFNPSMSFIGNTSSSPITLTVLTDNSLNWEGSQGSVFSIDSNLSSGEIFAVSDISGLPIISASAGQTVTINEFGGYTQIGNGIINSSSTTTGSLVVSGGLGVTANAFIGGTMTITNTTSSTGTNSGAFVVSGGLGLLGNAFIGGTVTLNNGTNSSGTNSGSLVVNGGLGITGNANIGGTVRITNTTASTSSSSGALTVSGGAGIGQSLFVGGNLNTTGSIFFGTNTYAKTLGSGDIALDNGTIDTPALLFYWGNNKNFGIDTFYPGTGTTKFRIVKELNESGGTELWSVDRNGLVNRSAWAPGETINTAMYNYSDLNMASTTTISSTTYTTFATVTYTPKSSTSYLWIEFSCTYSVSGTTADDFWSNIEVAGSEIVNSNQIWTGQVGGGTRSGVLFPLAARYTNTGTAGIAISVRSKRGTSDDNTTIYGNSASGFMRIQEIGR